MKKVTSFIPVSTLVIIAIFIASCSSSPIPNTGLPQKSSTVEILTRTQLPTNTTIFVPSSTPSPIPTSSPTPGITLGYGPEQFVEIFRVTLTGTEKIESITDKLETSLATTQSQLEKVILYYNISLVNLYATNPSCDQSSYEQQAQDIAQQSGYLRAEGTLLARFAMVMECQGNLDEASSLLEQATGKHIKEGKQTDLIADQINKAILEVKKGNVSQAIEQLEEARTLANDSHDETNTAASLANLCAIYAMSGDEIKALEYYKQAQEYNYLTVPFFMYYRTQYFSMDMPPLPMGIAGVSGISTVKANDGFRQFVPLDLGSYRSEGTSPIPCGFIEAPYFLTLP